MILTTTRNTLLTISFILLLTCTPVYRVDAASTVDETTNLLANTPDNQATCFHGKSASNVALQIAIYNEALAEELSRKEVFASRVTLNI